MKVKIDENTCTGCGLCADNCPEVFEMGDTVAKVIANPVPETRKIAQEKQQRIVL